MTPTAAVAYLRISEDRTGEQLGVTRQRAAVLALAESRGWTVVDVITENDTSAAGKVKRPGFARIVKHLQDGTARVVIAWDLTRLTRNARDTLAVLEAGQAASAVLAFVRSPELDLSTADGRTMAGILASMAQGEIDKKGERQRAANRQRAEQGRTTWTRRPFGFDRGPDGEVVLVEAEAAALRTAAARVLAGESLASVARGMPVPTSTGGRWTVTALRRLLLSPRHRGEVRYRGELLSNNTGPIIIEPEMQDQLAVVLTDPKRRQAPDTARRWLLSGLLLCGVDGCGKRMLAQPSIARGRRYMTYRCAERHLQRSLDLVDEVVIGVTLARLQRPDVLALLAPEVDVNALRAQAIDLRTRRDAIAGLLGDGLIGPDAARTQARKLTDQLRAIEAQVSAATSTSPAAALAAEDDVHAAWERLTVRQRADVVDTLATVRLLPAGKGGRFDPEHVVVEWRTA